MNVLSIVAFYNSVIHVVYAKTVPRSLKYQRSHRNQRKNKVPIVKLLKNYHKCFKKY